MTGAGTRARGFTLVELMIVIAIVAILVTIAIPNLRNIVAKSELKEAAGGLTTALNLARSEAIKRATTVTVCAIESSTVCQDAADTDKWSLGWRVFVDTNDDGVLDAGEALLREWPAPASRVTITGALNASTVVPEVAYIGNGLKEGGATDLVFDHCTDYGYRREVDISATGRPAILTESDVACP